MVNKGKNRLRGLQYIKYLIASAHIHAVEFAFRRWLWKKDLLYWKQLGAQILEESETGYKIKTASLDLITRQGEAGPIAFEEEVIVIAELDHDSYWLPRIGHLPGKTVTAEDEFIPRTRCLIRFVDVSGHAGINKDYQGNYWSFINELRSLYLLQKAGVRVPAVLQIDYERPSLTLSYIKGKVLADELVKRGAILLSRRRSRPDLAGLSREEQYRRAIQSAKGVVHQVVSQQFLDHLLDELEKIHAVRIVWNDVKYGNIIIEEETGLPYFIDFEHSRHYPWLQESLFSVLCEKEKGKVKDLF